MRTKRRRSKKRTRRVLLVEVLIAVVACAAAFAVFGLTGTLTVPATTKAGDGNNAIDANTTAVSSYYYNLNSNTPSLVASVVITFSAAHTPQHAYASLGGTWSSACSAAGSVFTCSFSSQPNVPFNTTTALRVVATG
jgi:hypothetical protein